MQAGSSSKSSPVGESGAAATSTTNSSATAVISDDVFITETIRPEPGQEERKNMTGKRKRCEEGGDEKGRQESQPNQKAQKHLQQNRESHSLSQIQAVVPNCGKAVAISLSSSSSATAQEEETQVCDSSVTDDLVLRMDGDKATSCPTSTTPSSTNVHTASHVSTTVLPIPNIPTTSTSDSFPSTSEHSSSSPSSISQERKDPLYAQNSSTATPLHLNCSKTKDVEISKKVEEERKGSREEMKESRDRVSGEGNLAIPSVNQNFGGENTFTTLEKRKSPGCEEETNKRVRLGDT